MSNRKRTKRQRAVDQFRKELKRRKSGSSTHSRLRDADRLMDGGTLAEAKDVLEGLDKKFPGRMDVLTRLVRVHYELGDWAACQTVCRRLLEIDPRDRESRLILGQTCLNMQYPAHALSAFRAFLHGWPNDPRGNGVRETIANLERLAADVWADLGFTGDDAQELAMLHEEVQLLLGQGEFRRSQQVAEQLLRREPDFIPAINNMSLAAFHDGRLDEAIDLCRRAVGIQDDNCHALSNLVRVLHLGGHSDEARGWAVRLNMLGDEQPDVWVKRMEALGVLGDDSAILDVFRGWRQSGVVQDKRQTALIYHYAAVSTMRLGDENEARRLWRTALSHSPSLSSAKDNLRDLQKPVAERHAPWLMGMENWLPRRTLRELIDFLQPAKNQRDDGALAEQTREFIAEHPQMEVLIQILLDCGDPAGREFAMMLAKLAKTEKVLEALYDFAFGQRGPDGMRSEAADLLREAGKVPSGEVRMWLQGEWRHVIVHRWELYPEPDDHEHSPEVEQLLDEALSALRGGDGKAGELALKRALELAPDAPDLMNNLAAAYEIQGRHQDVRSLAHQLYESHPEYVFGRTNLARLYVDEGRIDEAKQLVAPLADRRQLRFSELAALCDSQVAITVAEGRIDSARSWVNMWENLEIPDSRLDRWRRTLSKTRG